jgi:hypothetical protein
MSSNGMILGRFDKGISRTFELDLIAGLLAVFDVSQFVHCDGTRWQHFPASLGSASVLHADCGQI